MFSEILILHLSIFLLFLFYASVLKGKANPSMNRAFLLLVPLFSLILPFLSGAMTFFFASGPLPIEFRTPAVLVSEASLGVGEEGTGPSFFSFLLYAYALGFLIKLTHLLLKLRPILRFWKEGYPEVRHGYRFFRLPCSHAPFSFMGRTFLGQDTPADPVLLEHEALHVQKGHSWDLLYYEVLQILLWYDPTLPFLKDDLRTEHELQADQGVIQAGYHRESYSKYLLSWSSEKSITGPVHSFHRVSNLKKRITMIYEAPKRSKSLIAGMMTVPFLALALFVSSCQEQTKGPVKRPDQEPTFRSDEGLRGFIGKHLEYPESAKADSIEGKVFVEFVVGKDGQIGDIKVLKEPSPELGKAAREVIEQMPDWKSGTKNGEKVAASVVVPIHFKL